MEKSEVLEKIILSDDVIAAEAICLFAIDLPIDIKKSILNQFIGMMNMAKFLNATNKEIEKEEV